MKQLLRFIEILWIVEMRHFAEMSKNPQKGSVSSVFGNMQSPPRRYRTFMPLSEFNSGL